MNYLIVLLFISNIFAQDDLLSLLDDEVVKFPVFASFKGTRVVNAQSLELPGNKILQFMIQHRFGSIQNGFYDLYGLDYANVRFDLQYGYTPNLSFGIGRSTVKKTYDIFSKAKVLTQMNDNSIPVSVVFFSNIGINTKRKSSEDVAVDNLFINRMSYLNQLIIGKKFNRSFSLEILPTMIHRNIVADNSVSNSLYSFGTAWRYKFSKRLSINMEYFEPLGRRNSEFVNGWGVGFDIETGGHVFQIMLTNAQGAYEGAYIEEANGTLSKKNLYLGFNISRAFSYLNSDSKKW